MTALSQPESVRDPLIRQPPSTRLPHELPHASRVRKLAGRVPEIKLSQVPGQVLDGDVVVSTVDRPLQLAKESLGLVGGHLASGRLSHVFPGVVVYRLVSDELRPNRPVPGARVGVER